MKRRSSLRFSNSDAILPIFVHAERLNRLLTVMQARQERTQIEENSFYRLIDARAEPGSFDWHYHDECELVLIRSGVGTRYVGDSIEELEVGEFVIVGADLPHIWSPVADLPVGCEAAVIQIVRERMPRLDELEPVFELLDRASQGLLIRPGDAGELKAAIEDVWSATGLRRLLEILRLLDLCTALDNVTPLASTGYVHGWTRRQRRDNGSRISEIVDRIRSGLTEDLTQAEVARDIGLTPTSFSRFFRRETGRTFTAFVQELRISEACRLLTETELGVATIAYQVGFRSLAHFNKVFLRLKGRTPRQWRHPNRATNGLDPKAP